MREGKRQASLSEVRKRAAGLGLDVSTVLFDSATDSEIAECEGAIDLIENFPREKSWRSLAVRLRNLELSPEDKLLVERRLSNATRDRLGMNADRSNAFARAAFRRVAIVATQIALSNGVDVGPRKTATTNPNAPPLSDAAPVWSSAMPTVAQDRQPRSAGPQWSRFLRMRREGILAGVADTRCSIDAALEIMGVEDFTEKGMRRALRQWSGPDAQSFARLVVLAFGRGVRNRSGDDLRPWEAIRDADAADVDSRVAELVGEISDNRPDGCDRELRFTAFTSVA